MQALQAVQTGEEAVKQGRAIMIITVITIIFVSTWVLAAGGAITSTNNFTVASFLHGDSLRNEQRHVPR